MARTNVKGVWIVTCVSIAHVDRTHPFGRRWGRSRCLEWKYYEQDCPDNLSQKLAFRWQGPRGHPPDPASRLFAQGWRTSIAKLSSARSLVLHRTPPTNVEREP